MHNVSFQTHIQSPKLHILSLKCFKNILNVTPHLCLI